jgi:hypothetical protein
MFRILRLREKYGAVVSSSDELRRLFRVGPSSRIILNSVDKDHHLERFWAKRRGDGVLSSVRLLGADSVIAPNFSMFLDVPRTDNLSNRKRSLICAEELSQLGGSVIPYVGAVTPADWDYWHGFLRDHPYITTVAKEFQTGTSHLEVATRHINSLLRIQDSLGRGIHIVAIGGRRHIPRLLEFGRFSVIDSVPFMKAVYRHKLIETDNRFKWVKHPTPRLHPVDDLLAHNVCTYARFVQLKSLRGGEHTRLMASASCSGDCC